MKEDVKLAKWLEGAMDEKELREFEAAPGYETYRKIKYFSAEMSAPQVDTDSLYATITQERINKGKVRKLTPWFYKIAAMLVIAIGLSFFFYTTHTTTQVTEFAEHSEFLLPDNSEVMLNADSEAAFKAWNWKENRKVKLEGEAYFKVAKGQKFDVVTSLGTVTVMGTQFNVKARNNSFDITCYEGKVKVNSNEKEIVLTPGKSVSFKNGESMAMQTAEVKRPGWIDYEVSFTDEELTHVISEMERQYNISITIPQGSYSTFSGSLPMNDLNTALDNITTIYHFKVEKAGDIITLTSE